MANDYTPTTWAATVLQKLGYPVTAGGVQALAGWAKAEGGHWNNKARYNPLNTTQPEAGAGNTGAQGNIKVYKSWDQGIDATVQTLRNGRYSGILSGLRAGDPTAVAAAINSSPWGTSGSLVSQTIRATKGTVPTLPPATSTPDAAAATTTTTTPGVDNSGQRRALLANFLAQGGVKSQGATAELASGWQGLQDTPAQTTTTTTPGVSTSGATSVNSGTGVYKQRADAIDANHLPYQWGGGHGGKVTAATPVDCSGAVSEVLGIDPRVAAQFKSWGKAGDGGGKGITIAAKDTHVLMKIDGHWFGTSASNPQGGAGWIPQSALSPEYLRGFTLRHQ